HASRSLKTASKTTSERQARRKSCQMDRASAETLSDAIIPAPRSTTGSGLLLCTRYSLTLLPTTSTSIPARRIRTFNPPSAVAVRRGLKTLRTTKCSCVWSESDRVARGNIRCGETVGFLEVRQSPVEDFGMRDPSFHRLPHSPCVGAVSSRLSCEASAY